MQTSTKSSDPRVRMLCSWATEWLKRNERLLATEGVSGNVLVGRRALYVTSEQVLAAVHRTVTELLVAFERRPEWGADELGRASELAVRGLATRRLGDRLVDEARRSAHTPTLVDLDAPLPGDADEGLTWAETLPAPNASTAEDRLWLRQILADETPSVRRAVLSRGFCEPTMSRPSSAAAVRQSVHRFAKKHRCDLLDSAA